MNTAKMCLAVALTVIGSAGCATVHPWERGRLAQRCMHPDPYPSDSYLDEHVATSKEAAVGGAKLSGGGCGCN